jgi:DNA-binding transcriptional regulator YiaG
LRPRSANDTIEVVKVSELQELSRLRALLRSGAARSIRTAAGLSLGEVAEPLGVSKTSILRWERGQHAPRGDLALAYWQLLQSLMREGERV